MSVDVGVGATIARLRGDCTAALGRAIGPDDIMAIAVSGGPDSMALLALAAAAWPAQVIAATVDHGLRAGAAAEAAMVADFSGTLPFHGASPAKAGAQSWDDNGVARHPPMITSATGPRPSPGKREGGERGVPHTTLRPVTPLGTANLQAAARTVRYALLTDWATARNATLLLTAHHADDQAETFLMRAARGSGLAGLAGIRPRRQLTDRLTLLRPLLGWRRAELRDLCTAMHVPFIDDPSNASDRHDRTHFRALLAQAPWLDAAQIARSAGYLAEVDADLRALEAWLLDTRAAPAPPGDTAIDVAGLPREVRRRLVRAAIGQVRLARGIAEPAWSAAANIEPLLDALHAGKAATQAGVMAVATGDIWHFRPAPPRRDT